MVVPYRVVRWHKAFVVVTYSCQCAQNCSRVRPSGNHSHVPACSAPPADPARPPATPTAKPPMAAVRIARASCPAATRCRHDAPVVRLADELLEPATVAGSGLTASAAAAVATHSTSCRLIIPRAAVSSPFDIGRPSRPPLAPSPPPAAQTPPHAYRNSTRRRGVRVRVHWHPDSVRRNDAAGMPGKALVYCFAFSASCVAASDASFFSSPAPWGWLK
jgi:hypothetical protein